MTYDEIVLKMTGALTKDQCEELYDSNWWEVVGLAKAGFLQLHQKLLCMPFEKFHESVEFLLGREVYKHEFSSAGSLREESISGKSPTLQEIIDLIPSSKRLVIHSAETDGK